MLLLGFHGFHRINKRGFISFGHLGLMACIALLTATVVGGSGLLIRELHRQVSVAGAAVGLPGAHVDPSLLVPISSDMLKVSSIALGRTPVAIVNGVAVGEGGVVRVQTGTGVANVRVVRIRDGIVYFQYGEQSLLANLR